MRRRRRRTAGGRNVSKNTKRRKRKQPPKQRRGGSRERAREKDVLWTIKKRVVNSKRNQHARFARRKRERFLAKGNNI